MLQLKRFRELAELSQKEVAQRIDKTPQAYNFYELGKREPDLATLVKLADIFQTSIDTLLNHTPLDSTSSQHVMVSHDERQLLTRFRSLPQDKQKSLMDYISFLCEHTDDEQSPVKRSHAI
jgi:transcriptional regulator with XRE-family HTH domain